MIVLRITEKRLCNLCHKCPGRTASVTEIFDDNNIQGEKLYFCARHMRYLGPEIVKYLEGRGGVGA